MRFQFAAGHKTSFIGGLALALLIPVALLGQGANPEPVEAPDPAQTLTANQLDDLVAPIALYPDPLLGQVLVAATYPLEVVEASQWLAKNQGLAGAQLTEAAAQQNWDPSVQALIPFPDVLKLLNEDVTWTTNLGNAFLAQQTEVMDAVQTMRQKAQQAGKLQSTPQQTVQTDNDGGQEAIDIEPANSDEMYVPEYDPAWIWGPAVWYPYPGWYWPPTSVIYGGLGFGFYPPVIVGIYFGGGWGGWSHWGWRPAWTTRTLVVNNTFIHRYNLNTAGLTSLHGSSAWAHNPEHRNAVPYPSAALNQRYGGTVRQNLSPRPVTYEGSAAGQGERVGNRYVAPSTPSTQNGSAFGGYESRSTAQAHSDHGYSSLGPSRSAPAPHYSAPASHGGGGRR